ncbi:MAG: hypothetical protein PHD87_00615 [Candidatus Cloacimonetes bacterium]|nr:hypothetical protein [Candidatus Cloacimonadota bacterium]
MSCLDTNVSAVPGNVIRNIAILFDPPFFVKLFNPLLLKSLWRFFPTRPKPPLTHPSPASRQIAASEAGAMWEARMR